MNKLFDIISQPEGRKLEFKETLPSKSDLAKTIISFANDAGGEFYLGIKDNPREIIGINEDELISIEEKISNIIHDNCHPIILSEINAAGVTAGVAAGVTARVAARVTARVIVFKSAK